MIRRKNIALVLCFAMIVCLAACGAPAETPKAPIKKAEAVSESTTDWAKGNAVKTADSKKYVQQNNLKITEINLKTNASDDSFGSRYIQISGLKNRDVENSINKEIKDTFFGLTDGWKSGELPARRGLALEAEKYDLTNPTNTYAYCYSGANFSNILSVYMYASAAYPLKDSVDQYDFYYNLNITRTECLNFDLNTGKQIKLGDVAADSEGLDYFSRKMAEVLQKSDASEEGYFYSGADDIWFKLVGEYPGLKEDQKYYISEYGNSVTLIFDEETPWIQADDYGYASYSLPIDGVSALSQRFAGSSSLFEDEEAVYALLPNNFDQSGYISVDKYDDPDYDPRIEGTDIYVWSEYSYYEDMPDEIAEYVYGDQELREKYNKEALDAYNDYTAQGYNVGGSIDDNGYVGRIGDITYVSWYYYAYLYNQDAYGTLFNRSFNYTYNFKGEDTRPMAFEDFFKPGADARTLAIDAQIKSFKNVEPLYDWYLESLRKEIKEEDMRLFLGELYDRGFTYSPSYYYLSLNFNQDDINELVGKYFPKFSNDTWALTSGIYTLYYKDLGCSNLTLFD